ncbi:MAG TPA: tetratricopeptide repeat protein [Phycisphaerales bacterium]|nr:tetratricopeptide repeat protein [Phycisphaerales bacterium]HMP36978.1 tetratricopeptide repeat protein [Phycisphaerales bacterium]
MPGPDGRPFVGAWSGSTSAPSGAARSLSTRVSARGLALSAAAAAAVALGGCDRASEPAVNRGSVSAPSDEESARPVAAEVPPDASAATDEPVPIVGSIDSGDRSAAFAETPRPPEPRGSFRPADPRIDIARRMIQTQEFAVAEVALRTVLREMPGTAQAEFLLGVAIQKQKRYGEARTHFERAITLKQSYPEVDHAFHFLGWAEYYLGDMTASRQAFEEHLRRVPDEADSVFGLGLVALEEDRTDDAEALFLRNLDMLLKRGVVPRVDVAKARARLGDVYLRLDRDADAERELISAVRFYPDAYEAWAKLARIYDRAGRTDDAAEARSKEREALRRLGRQGPEEAPAADGRTAPGGAAEPGFGAEGDAEGASSDVGDAAAPSQSGAGAAARGFVGGTR